MKAKTLALFARHEIRGCRQAEPIGDHCVELFMDPFDFQRADITAFCTRYHAYVDDTAFTDDYIAYFLCPTERAFFRPDKRKQVIFKLNRDVDADIIGWLDSIPNIHDYLRHLIRADMARLPKYVTIIKTGDTDIRRIIYFSTGAYDAIALQDKSNQVHVYTANVEDPLFSFIPERLEDKEAFRKIVANHIINNLDDFDTTSAGWETFQLDTDQDIIDFIDADEILLDLLINPEMKS